MIPLSLVDQKYTAVEVKCDVIDSLKTRSILLRDDMRSELHFLIVHVLESMTSLSCSVKWRTRIIQLYLKAFRPCGFHTSYYD